MAVRSEQVKPVDEVGESEPMACDHEDFLLCREDILMRKRSDIAIALPPLPTHEGAVRTY